MNQSTATESTFAPETALGACRAQETALSRLTPDLVLSAYRATRLRPVRNRFGSTTSGHTGCGLTALYYAATEGGWLNDAPSPTFAASERLGLDVEYACGFIAGWDGSIWPSPHGESLADWERLSAGYADGMACWLAAEREYSAKEAS